MPMTSTSPERSLAGVAMLQSIPPSDLEALARRCGWRRYAAGQEILEYHDETRDVFFLVSGTVRVSIYSMSGKVVTFRDIGAGSTFGEFAAIDGQPRSASVLALSDATVAAMPPGLFWEVLRKYPEVAAENLKHLTAQIRLLSERIYEFSTLAVKNRIHAELLRLARDNLTAENQASIAPAPTHAEIAARVSTHREAVTRELSHLAKEGLVERREGALVIFDVDRLEEMVREVLGE